MLLPPGRLSGTPPAALARSQRVFLFLASLIAGSPIPSLLLALSSHPSSPAYAGTSDALTVRGGPLGSCRDIRGHTVVNKIQRRGEGPSSVPSPETPRERSRPAVECGGVEGRGLLAFRFFSSSSGRFPSPGLGLFRVRDWAVNGPSPDSWLASVAVAADPATSLGKCSMTSSPMASLGLSRAQGPSGNDPG